MTSRDFCYWLQGFLELSTEGGEGAFDITARQMLVIRKHLKMVFVHESDPSHGDSAHQAKLTEAHGTKLSDLMGQPH